MTRQSLKVWSDRWNWQAPSRRCFLLSRVMAFQLLLFRVTSIYTMRNLSSTTKKGKSTILITHTVTKTCSSIHLDHEDQNLPATDQFDQHPSPPMQRPPNVILPKTRRTPSRRPARGNSCVCGFEPTGIPKNRKGNLKRHIKGCKVVRQQSDPESLQSLKPWMCEYPHCGRRFTRADNLAVHQRAKNHTPSRGVMASPAAEWSDGDGGSRCILPSQGMIASPATEWGEGDGASRYIVPSQSMIASPAGEWGESDAASRYFDGFQGGFRGNLR